MSLPHGRVQLVSLKQLHLVSTLYGPGMVVYLNVHSDRRSQYIITGQNVPSSAETSSVEEDVEGGPLYRDETERITEFSEAEDEDLTPMPRDEPLISNLEWDEDVGVAQSAPIHSTHRRTLSRQQSLGQWRTDYRGSPLGVRQAQPPPPPESSTEQTPLLQKTPSKSSIALTLPSARRDSGSDATGSNLVGPRLSFSAQDGKGPLRHKISSVSTRSEKLVAGGQSTFGQTVGTCVW